MISLGRDLIASLNGKNYPLKRDFGGYYQNGKWVPAEGNRVVLSYEDSAVEWQAKLRAKIPAMAGVVVTGAYDVGFTITFPNKGAQPLLTLFSNDYTIPDDVVNVTVTRTQIGDNETVEVQEVVFSDEPEGGSGLWEFGSVPSLVCFASQQPLSGSEIVRIPEGDRERERMKLYSADLLREGREGDGGYDADVVTVDGLDYQVESVQKWTDYWKCVIVSVEPPEKG